eukprot:Selendium_serpulae@DN3675_c0_g1_i1.p1
MQVTQLLFALIFCTSALAQDGRQRDSPVRRARKDPRNVRRSRVDEDELFNFPNNIQSVEDYADGDLDEDLLALAIPDFEPMIGRWESALEISEPADNILAALGVSFIRRNVFRRSTTQVQITDIQTTPQGRDFVTIISFLPANTIKEGQIFVDDQPFAVVVGLRKMVKSVYLFPSCVRPFLCHIFRIRIPAFGSRQP